jgi:serine/threonine protein kinase
LGPDEAGPCDASRFQAAGFDTDASFEGPDSAGASRFEAPGFVPSDVRARAGADDDRPVPELGVGEAESVSEFTASASDDTSRPRPRLWPVSLPSAGDTVGEFRLLASLGRGVRGAVFLAEQPGLANRVVVLKITPRDGREHLSLARLQHPHIVPLYSVQDLVERDLRLLCMPYLGGTPLTRILNELEPIPVGRRRGQDLLEALNRVQSEAPLSVPNQGPARQFLARASYLQAVCWLGACLADALADAHRRDLVHLDLKPSNILIAADGTPLLLDFHLARPPIRPNDPAQPWIGGTPHYMSPEQRLAMSEIHSGVGSTVGVDGRSDIYALGLVLFRALGGAISNGPLPMHPCKIRRLPGVPAGMVDIVGRCLAPDPRDRYPDAALLGEDLRRQLGDLPLRGVRNRSVVERLRKWGRRHPQALPVAVRAIAAAAVPLVSAWLIAIGDARQRIQGAQSLLADARTQMARHDYAGASETLSRGMAVINGSWMHRIDREPPAAHDLRRDFKHEHDRARRHRVADELHDLAEHLRVLYQVDTTSAGDLGTLEQRLRRTWASRLRILTDLGAGLDEDLDRRLRIDLQDLGILWADISVRMAPGDPDEARREALQTLDEAERLFGASAVLARERQSLAEALGLTDVARAAALRLASLPTRTAWEHYALGRSLLKSGQLEAAAAELDRAVELQPQHFGAQFTCGLCAYRQRRFDKALRAFEVCVALSPGTGPCYYNRGLAHAALGHADLARRDREQAARLGLQPSEPAPDARPSIPAARQPRA